MLDSFFNLGFNRSCCRQVALILLCSVCLADFSTSDSAALADIRNQVTDIAIYSAALDELYDIRTDVQSIQNSFYYFRNYGLRSITNGIWSIWDKINTDHQRHFLGTETTVYQDSIYTHDVRNDDIFFRLGHIESAINNLTNYLCYSPQYVSGVSAIYTNSAFLNIPVMLNGDDIEEYVAYLYTALTGQPFSRENYDDLFTLIDAFGSREANFQQYLMHIGSPESINGKIWGNSSARTIYSSLQDGVWFDTDPQLGALGQLYYEEYGTKRLTDAAIGISNVLDSVQELIKSTNDSFHNSVNGDSAQVEIINNSLEQPITYNEQTESVENNSTIVNTVSDLADDWLGTLPSVSTNIVSANTNAITNIQDNDYQAGLNSISQATPDSVPGYFNDTLDEINLKSDNFSTDFASILEESTEEFKFSFDLSGFQLGQMPSRLRDTSPFLCEILVSDVKSTTNDYVDFFCDFLEVLLTLYFAGLLWNLIYDSKAGTW